MEKTVRSVLLISAFKNNHIAEIKLETTHGTLRPFVFLSPPAQAFISRRLLVCFAFQAELRCRRGFSSYEQKISIWLLFPC